MIVTFTKGNHQGNASIPMSTLGDAIVMDRKGFNDLTESIRVSNDFDTCIVINIIPLPI